MSFFRKESAIKRPLSSSPLLGASYLVVTSRQIENPKNGVKTQSAASDTIGRFQFLKTLNHPNLCEYVEAVKGDHDRIFVIAEHHENSLQKFYYTTEPAKATTVHSPDSPTLLQFSIQILSALAYLHGNGIVHRNLAPRNIRIHPDGSLKLSSYGLYYMTGCARDVDFPVGYAEYLSPEAVVTWDQPTCIPKMDIWSLGIVLCELYTGAPFWTDMSLSAIFTSLLSMSQWHSSSAQINGQPNKESNGTSTAAPNNLWDHPDASKLNINTQALLILQSTEFPRTDLEHFIRTCLEIDLSYRPTAQQLLSHPFLTSNHSSINSSANPTWELYPYLSSSFLPNPENESSNSEIDPLLRLPFAQLYHLYCLAGGNPELDLRRHGLIPSTPIIARLPRLVRAVGMEQAHPTRDAAHLYSDSIYLIGPNTVYERLQDRSFAGGDGHEDGGIFMGWDTDYFLVQEEDEVNFLVEERSAHSSSTTTFNTSHNVNYNTTLPSATDTRVKGPLEDFLFSEKPPARSLSPLAPLSPPTIQSPLSSVSNPHLTSAHPTLPIQTRERSLPYQYHRLHIFTTLLEQYPASREEILHHAKIDIPPLLRGVIWAAILGVSGDLEAIWDNVILGKTISDTDRQIDVDVPRCHQYNVLLASSTGHDKLRRLLKTWVAANNGLVYWQGFDSLSAPFLALNFNNLPLAFASLQLFIPRFLRNFFLSDNSPVIDEYFAVFRQLLSFHDPELSCHLTAISFTPDLYAIRWFLTLFTHVLPLEKVYHLWDKILVGPPSLPLFVGISILRQIRDTLLRSEFNDCIVLFSERFPDVDIDRCIQTAMAMCKVTPLSVVARVFDPDVAKDGGDVVEEGSIPDQRWWEQPIPLASKMKEMAPRISLKDLIILQPYALVLDIRSDADFNRGHLPSSINLHPNQLSTVAPMLKKLNKKYHIVLAKRGEAGPEFAKSLIQSTMPRVALLHGGIDAIRVGGGETALLTLCTCKPKKQTTMAFKSKGTEPGFTILRCKIPVAGAAVDKKEG